MFESINKQVFVCREKLPLWAEALSNLGIRFNVSYPVPHTFSNTIGSVPIHSINVFLYNETRFQDLKNLVSLMAYERGFVKNLTKKENLNVRKADRQISEKVCPSTGEACQHDDGSGNCLCEGESERLIPDGRAINLDSMPDAREKRLELTDEFIKQVESEFGLGYV